MAQKAQKGDAEMLWQKAWRETRWRFMSALLVLTMMAGSNVFDYLATQRLLPSLNATTDSPVAETSGLAAMIREAIELQRDFRGFIWYQAFRQNLTQMGVFFAVLLGCGGLLHESTKGSALFTLSLPVTRTQLLGARAGTGLAQLFGIAMVPPLAIPLLAPSIGQHFTIVDALAHGLCIFFVGAVFFSLASFLSTMFADIWRPMLIAIGIACALAVVSFAVPPLNIFSVMNGESYFKTGSLPWAGFLTSAVIATALLYSAAETLERRDF
jgi:ABC-type transport system involved in multi-copper enzyme maturation permease subunit